MHNKVGISQALCLLPYTLPTDLLHIIPNELPPAEDLTDLVESIRLRANDGGASNRAGVQRAKEGGDWRSGLATEHHRTQMNRKSGGMCHVFKS